MRFSAPMSETQGKEKRCWLNQKVALTTLLLLTVTSIVLLTQFTNVWDNTLITSIYQQGSLHYQRWRPSPGPGKSFVTYSQSVIIQCLDSSPYILCSGRPAPRPASEQAADAARHAPFKVAWAREVTWFGKPEFSQYRYSNCEFVAGGPQPDTTLVAFNGVGLGEDQPRPHRHDGQAWAFLSWESPVHTRASFANNESSLWNKAFSMTITYRTDSNVFIPYGFLVFEPTPLDKRPDYYEIAMRKTKSVAWFVSNCQTPSRRMEYVKRMQKYIDVDIYGACGTPCPRFNQRCEKDLYTKYKFYLSFENSLCTDYVTEKFFKLFHEGIYTVPVVRGGAAYRKYFPEDTFVNSADFASPRQLAEHLKELGSDLERYAQVLEHKDQYRWLKGSSDFWCGICEVLNTKGASQKMYNMKRWWSDGHCHSATDL